MISGNTQAIQACSYSESRGIFRVHSGNTIYELDTSTTPPRLFIDGNFTKEGRGNYSNSLTRDCELFIALSNLKEGFSATYANYHRGLCVLQVSKP